MLDFVLKKRHIFPREVFQVTTNFLFSYFNWAAFVMKENESFKPIRVHIFKTSIKMLETCCTLSLVELCLCYSILR
jgi:hypothetical protein